MAYMRLADFVELNPRVRLERNKAYEFIPMDVIAPGNRYVESSNQREFTGGGTKFADGDVLFARITPCLENGKIAQFRSRATVVGFGSTEFIVLRARDGISDPSFVFYLALSDFIRKPAEKSMSGASGRQRADINVVANLAMDFPDLSTQIKIGALLSDFDDLIENNTRRIRILEQIARDLYQEWFVHFRFPGHELADHDQLHEGWREGYFTDFVDVLSGGTPSTKKPEFWDGDIPFYSPKDATDAPYVIETERNITNLGLERCNSQLYPKNTVFITARGTVGKVKLPAVDMAMNQSCYALVGKDDVPQLFVYLLTLQHVDDLVQQATGAVFDTIIIDNFRRLRVTVPSPKPLNDFVAIVNPVFDQIRNLQLRNRVLMQTRNLLLPRLISGELEVSELDMDVLEPTAEYGA